MKFFSGVRNCAKMCVNCTVVELIEHFVYQIEYTMSTESDGGEDIQQLLNDTDSELSGLSHLDAPNESLYMIGGVLIAMFLVGVIIILLAITISKLRKREEHSNSVHPADVVLQTAPAPPTATPAPLSATTQQTNNVQLQPSLDSLPNRGQFLWQYPPQPQQYQYSNNQDTLIRALPTERPGIVQGFRKNLGGRWRRFVKRKTSPEVYVIPPELRPQLKTIYVY